VSHPLQLQYDHVESNALNLKFNSILIIQIKNYQRTLSHMQFGESSDTGIFHLCNQDNLIRLHPTNHYPLSFFTLMGCGRLVINNLKLTRVFTLCSFKKKRWEEERLSDREKRIFHILKLNVEK